MKEYEVVSFDSWEELQNSLNDVASDGWEFTTAISAAPLFHGGVQNAAIVERQVPDQEPEAVVADFNQVPPA